MLVNGRGVSQREPSFTYKTVMNPQSLRPHLALIMPTVKAPSMAEINWQIVQASCLLAGSVQMLSPVSYSPKLSVNSALAMIEPMRFRS